MKSQELEPGVGYTYERDARLGLRYHYKGPTFTIVFNEAHDNMVRCLLDTNAPLLSYLVFMRMASKIAKGEGSYSRVSIEEYTEYFGLKSTNNIYSAIAQLRGIDVVRKIRIGLYFMCPYIVFKGGITQDIKPKGEKNVYSEGRRHSEQDVYIKAWEKGVTVEELLEEKENG
jgi:hypothetical protein